jgi:hypothetical protein
MDARIHPGRRTDHRPAALLDHATTPTSLRASAVDFSCATKTTICGSSVIEERKMLSGNPRRTGALGVFTRPVRPAASGGVLATARGLR